MKKNLASDKDKRFIAPFLSEIASAHLLEGSATVSYYLLFSLFPFLMFFSALISDFPLDLLKGYTLNGVIPEKALTLLKGYFYDMADHKSWLFLGLVLTITSLGKAVEAIKRRVRAAYRSDPDISLVAEKIISIVFVVLILLSLFATLVLIVAGEEFIFEVSSVPALSDFGSFLLRHFRFAICGIFIFLVIWGINLIFPATSLKLKETLPGTLFSVIAMLTMSRLFSYYVDRLNGFSLLYGSLGGVIVLLSWLYLFSFLLLLGSYINAYLYRSNREVRF